MDLIEGVFTRLGLRLTFAREIMRHCGVDEILQGRLIDRVAFVDVDGAPDIPLEAGVDRPVGSFNAAPLANVILTALLKIVVKGKILVRSQVRRCNCSTLEWSDNRRRQRLSVKTRSWEKALATIIPKPLSRNRSSRDSKITHG